MFCEKRGLVKEFYYIVGEKFYRDGKQNDTEKFADEIDAACAEQIFDKISEVEHDKHPHHIEHEGDENVHVGILCLKREQCGECAGTGE